MPSNLLTQLKQYDETREGIPGEHWMVLTAGLGLWYLSAKQQSTIVKLIGMAAATALIGRAARSVGGRRDFPDIEADLMNVEQT